VDRAPLLQRGQGLAQLQHTSPADQDQVAAAAIQLADHPLQIADRLGGGDVYLDGVLRVFEFYQDFYLRCGKIMIFVV
jgi:hypothetical protein